ncbi:MAG: AbgT family transporter [Erysipelothrix sp.]|jgi:aminobenzoyl-glutamate transport protein|nr:AbgT family transporter [Erysipelothrix sp.]
MSNKQGKKSLLDRIEQAGNRLPHPVTMFVILAGFIVLISALLAQLGISVTYETINTQTQEVVVNTVLARSLLDADGIRHLFTTVISNFTGFFALGTVFTIIVAVSVAEGSGLISALMRKVVAITPKSMVSATVVFLGVMSNVASSTGYVVLVPLGAIIFKSFKKHPIAGLAAAFAGVSGGWSANLLIGSNDPMFAGISTQAARFIDINYTVLPTANWYFMVVSTFLITIIGTIITEKIVIPRLGEYTFNDEDKVEDIASLEKRGLRFALVGLVGIVGLILMLVLPSNAILNPTGNILVSPFMSSIIAVMSLIFFVPGLLYGIGAKTITSDKELVEVMVKGISGIASFLVLVFFAAQFVSAFNYSNLGIILSVSGANFLQNIGFIGLPLIIAFIILTAFINIFIAVDSAKWIIMAPIFVPMFMRLGLSPELAQVVYRIGDSSTNIISPLMPFFPLAVAFSQKYDMKFGVGSLITTMAPYSIAFLVGWTLLFVVWFLLGLPLGPGAGLLY